MTPKDTSQTLPYSESAYLEENDFVIMGNFNVDSLYFDDDSTSDLDVYHWVIDDSLDTTTKSTDYTYDRIVSTDNNAINIIKSVFKNWKSKGKGGNNNNTYTPLVF